ncbi:hypothetical protein [Nostoc sp. TCL26-01]|nr:hypothetical protein [Nostoc sp. TCL26-01]
MVRRETQQNPENVGFRKASTQPTPTIFWQHFSLVTPVGCVSTNNFW